MEGIAVQSAMSERVARGLSESGYRTNRMLDSDREDRCCIHHNSIAVHILQYQSHIFLVSSNAATPFEPCMRDPVHIRYVGS